MNDRRLSLLITALAVVNGGIILAATNGAQIGGLTQEQLAGLAGICALLVPVFALLGGATPQAGLTKRPARRQTDVAGGTTPKRPGVPLPPSG